MTQPKEYLQVSYSSLNQADTCLRKFEFNKLYPRRPRDPDAFAADVGSALHHGYQDYLIHGNRDQAIWNLMKDYPYAGEFSARTEDRSLESAMATLDEMMDSTSLDEWELLEIKRPLNAKELAENLEASEKGFKLPYDPSGLVVPAIEVPFEIRLEGIDLPDGRGISYTGFMDAAMRNLGTGVNRSLDIKTHRRTIEDATPKYKFDSQQVPYGLVLEHITGNRVEEFEVLYFDCFVDLVSPRVNLFPFKKDSVDLQEWLINTVLRAQRIQKAMEMDYFPRCDGGCMQWNRPCYFLDICETRDKEAITEWILMGDTPEVKPRDQPWIVATIDVFGTGAES